MICSFDLSHFANTLAHQVWSDYTANRSLIFSQVRATDGTMEHESMENLSGACEISADNGKQRQQRQMVQTTGYRRESWAAQRTLKINERWPGNRLLSTQVGLSCCVLAAVKLHPPISHKCISAPPLCVRLSVSHVFCLIAAMATTLISRFGCRRSRVPCVHSW